MTINLCIPRVLNTIDEKQIRKLFESLKFGEIDKVLVIRKKNEKYNIAFVYYKKWYETDNAVRALDRLTNNKEIKIVHNSPWFWKVVKTEPREKERENR